MTRLNVYIALYLLTASLIALGLAQTVSAQTTKIEGTIKARRGEIMILTTSSSPSVPVYLTDSTQVGQVQGLLQARRKAMSMAALIPGLQVKVEGTLNEQGQLIATSVSFKGNDLEDAQKIEAGMHETKEELQKQKEELKYNIIFTRETKKVTKEIKWCSMK